MVVVVYLFIFLLTVDTTKRLDMEGGVGVLEVLRVSRIG